MLIGFKDSPSPSETTTQDVSLKKVNNSLLIKFLGHFIEQNYYCKLPSRLPKTSSNALLAAW